MKWGNKMHNFVNSKKRVENLINYLVEKYGDLIHRKIYNEEAYDQLIELYTALKEMETVKNIMVWHSFMDAFRKYENTIDLLIIFSNKSDKDGENF